MSEIQWVPAWEDGDGTVVVYSTTVGDKTIRIEKLATGWRWQVSQSGTCPDLEQAKIEALRDIVVKELREISKRRVTPPHI